MPIKTTHYNQPFSFLSDMLSIKDVPDDGNCFYHAISTALNYNNDELACNNQELKKRAHISTIEQVKNHNNECSNKLNDLFILACKTEIEQLGDQQEALNQEAQNLEGSKNYLETEQQKLEAENQLNQIKEQQLKDISSQIEEFTNMAEYYDTIDNIQDKKNVIIKCLETSLADPTKFASQLQIKVIAEYLNRPIYIVSHTGSETANFSINKINDEQKDNHDPIFIYFNPITRHYQALLTKPGHTYKNVTLALDQIDNKNHNIPLNQAATTDYNNYQQPQNHQEPQQNSIVNLVTSIVDLVKPIFEQLVIICQNFFTSIKNLLLSDPQQQEQQKQSPNKTDYQSTTNSQNTEKPENTVSPPSSPPTLKFAQNQGKTDPNNSTTSNNLGKTSLGSNNKKSPD